MGDGTEFRDDSICRFCLEPAADCGGSCESARRLLDMNRGLAVAERIAGWLLGQESAKASEEIARAKAAFIAELEGNWKNSPS